MKQKATLGDKVIEFEWDSTNPDFDSWTVGKLREEAQEKQAKDTPLTLNVLELLKKGE